MKFNLLIAICLALVALLGSFQTVQADDGVWMMDRRARRPRGVRSFGRFGRFGPVGRFGRFRNFGRFGGCGGSFC